MLEHDELSRIQRLVQTIRPDCTVLYAWPLEGGVSAQVTAFEIEHPEGRTERLVLRRHGIANRERNPDIARDEFSLLALLHRAGLPVPKPIHVDSACDHFPTPYGVVEYITGSTDVEPADYRTAIHQMADFLSDLHLMNWSGQDLSFLPELGVRLDDMLLGFRSDPEESPDITLIRTALESHLSLPRMNAPVLLHGDYWRGNIIRKDGQIAAVVDWEDAALGDPLADLAKCRIETHWLFGPDAMAQFTERYTARMPALDLANLPFWELYAALGPTTKLSTWGLDPDVEAGMRAVIREHVERALAALATRSGKL